MKTIKEKELLLSKLKSHQEADDFIRGLWLQSDGVKGCFYGCTMKTKETPREKFSEKYDIDLWYCYLTEKIFEGLPDGEFQSFPFKSIEILPLNFDFNKIKSEWNKKILLKQLDWVTDAEIREVLINTAKLFDVDFDKIDKKAARSAESAAWSAARSAESAASAASAVSAAASAAWSAAMSAARSAESAASAARSAARSAESAAWSAARSAESAASAASAARSGYYTWMRDTLFNLILENHE